MAMGEYYMRCPVCSRKCWNTDMRLNSAGRWVCKGDLLENEKMEGRKPLRFSQAVPPLRFGAPPPPTFINPRERWEEHAVVWESIEESWENL